MVFSGAPSAFGTIRSVVAWWDKFDGGKVCAKESVQISRCFVVEAHNVDFVANSSEESKGSTVGTHVLLRSATFHQFDVNVIVPDGQQHVLMAAAGNAGETSRDIGMAYLLSW